MTDLFEKSMETLELPRVLSLLADQAVTEEGKERARRLRPETDPAEVALRLKETTAAVNKMVLRGSPSFSGVKPVAGSLDVYKRQEWEGETEVLLVKWQDDTTLQATACQFTSSAAGRMASWT